MKLIVDVAKGTHEYVALTPAEIAERDQAAAQHAVEEAERKATEQAEADAKLAAQAKLQALGLSGEEVAALTK
jgi:sugar-specific transcriptional regulator TrmB